MVYYIKGANLCKILKEDNRWEKSLGNTFLKVVYNKDNPTTLYVEHRRYKTSNENQYNDIYKDVSYILSKLHLKRSKRWVSK